MAENITTQSAEIDLLLGWSKKMSDFNFVSEFDDRILEYVMSLRVGLCVLRVGKTTEDERERSLLHTDSYIYA